MFLDRVNGNIEQVGDLFTGHTVLHAVADLDFSGSQLVPNVRDPPPERGRQVFDGPTVLLDPGITTSVELDSVQRRK